MSPECGTAYVMSLTDDRRAFRLVWQHQPASTVFRRIAPTSLQPSVSASPERRSHNYDLMRSIKPLNGAAAAAAEDGYQTVGAFKNSM